MRLPQVLQKKLSIKTFLVTRWIIATLIHAKVANPVELNACRQ